MFLLSAITNVQTFTRDAGFAELGAMDDDGVRNGAWTHLMVHVSEGYPVDEYDALFQLANSFPQASVGFVTRFTFLTDYLDYSMLTRWTAEFVDVNLTKRFNFKLAGLREAAAKKAAKNAQENANAAAQAALARVATMLGVTSYDESETVNANDDETVFIVQPPTIATSALIVMPRQGNVDDVIDAVRDMRMTVHTYDTRDRFVALEAALTVSVGVQQNKVCVRTRVFEQAAGLSADASTKHSKHAGAGHGQASRPLRGVRRMAGCPRRR